MSTEPEKPIAPDGSPEDQAAAWFARERKGFSPEDEAAWARWLAADPKHAPAFGDIETTWKGLEAARAEPEIIALREAALRRGRRPFRTLAAATSLAALAAVSVLAVVLPRYWSSAPRLYAQTEAKIDAAAQVGTLPTQDYHTSVGETRPITLTDGSVVTLDTDSAVRVVASDKSRLIILAHGRAFFQVIKDPTHPFIVFAGNERVMAVGTAFGVRLDGEDVSVTLREGKVRVEAPSLSDLIPRGAAGAETTNTVEAADLVPGTKLSAPNHSSWHLAKLDVARDLSWLNGQLVFNGDSLGDAVDEMNRYSDRKIVLGDAALGRVRVSGVFEAGQVDAFAQALQAYKLARVAARTSKAITLIGP